MITTNKEEQRFFKETPGKLSLKREQHKMVTQPFYIEEKESRGQKSCYFSQHIWVVSKFKKIRCGSKHTLIWPRSSACYSSFLIILNLCNNTCLHSLAITRAFIWFYKIRNIASLTYWEYITTETLSGGGPPIHDASNCEIFLLD